MFVPGAALPCDKLQFLAHADAQRCLLFLGILQHLARVKPSVMSLLGTVLGSVPRLAGWDDARLRVAVVKLQDGGLLPSPDTQVAVRISAALGAQCTETAITLSPCTGPRENTFLTTQSALSLLQALRCRWAAAVARRRMPCGLACSDLSGRVHGETVCFVHAAHRNGSSKARGCHRSALAFGRRSLGGLAPALRPALYSLAQALC